MLWPAAVGCKRLLGGVGSQRAPGAQQNIGIISSGEREHHDHDTQEGWKPNRRPWNLARARRDEKCSEYKRPGHQKQRRHTTVRRNQEPATIGHRKHRHAARATISSMNQARYAPRKTNAMRRTAGSIEVGAIAVV